jgi:hypothetical protein
MIWITEVTDVSMIEVERVMPRGARIASFPRTRPKSDYGSPVAVNGVDLARDVDTSFKADPHAICRSRRVVIIRIVTDALIRN